MRFSARDLAVTAVVLILSSLLVVLYVQERGRTTYRSGEKALGTIVFKKLNATRRAQSALVWERIRNNSPVYAADTLRTADASEAEVCFDDGTSLDMYENSMLRLEFKGKMRTLEFLGGDISVSGSKGKGGSELSGLAPEAGGTGSGYTISAGGKTIALSEDSRATLSRTGSTLSVAVSEGQVGVTDSLGASETLDRSKELHVNLETGISQVLARPILPLFPEQNARLLLERVGKANLRFAWEGEGQASLELSQTRDFERPAVSARAGGGSLELGVEPGTWYWRLRSEDGSTSPEQRFTLYAEQPPQPILPASGAELSYRKILPAVRFSWTRMESAAAYVFEVASDPGFAKPLRRDRTSMEAITV
ncbi:MAG TPA: FecR domain-containing protein, partial [Rectinemataceae bacterium]|nr:FecR domain-containing protein [Rectinemataceae bacterium]